MSLENSFRNSSGPVSKMRRNGHAGRGEVVVDTAAAAYGRGDNFDVVSVSPSKLRVPCSNHGGRALFDAVSDDSGDDLQTVNAGFLPRRCVDAHQVRAAYTAVRLARGARR